jgi:hypothetical protein
MTSMACREGSKRTGVEPLASNLQVQPCRVCRPLSNFPPKELPVRGCVCFGYVRIELVQVSRTDADSRYSHKTGEGDREINCALYRRVGGFEVRVESYIYIYIPVYNHAGGSQKQVLSVNLTTYERKPAAYVLFAMLFSNAMLSASGGPRMHRFTNNKTTTEQKITATASGWWWFSSFRRVWVTFGRSCFVCTSLHV